MIYLEPPQGKHYVRSFLFSRRIDAPFAQVHLIARALLVLCLSAVQLRAIDTAHPDPAAAALLFLISLALFLVSGMLARMARLYFLLTLPALLSLFTTWTLFNPVPGSIVLARFPLYSGRVVLGLGLWQAVWLVIVVGYTLWTHRLVSALFLATIITFVLTRFVSLPSWPMTSIAFFHPPIVFVSDRGLLIALTKVIGYLGMVLATIALVVTSRDVELIGALRQLRIPQPIIFFLSTVFRTLELTLSDYETIRQAQRARAIDARPRSTLKRLRDLGSMAVPMVATMIRRSSEIGDALLARGFRLQQRSTDFYETSPWRGIDWFVLVCCLLLLTLALLPHFNITTLLERWV